ncbi:5-carboxymethyl-2-hydroxymuconate isomerase [Paraburkholderia unamae]|uniref:5-carboxymethyl-2-hydroxymuconate isomerase n=2 Tax=Paraburkholderia unamae TaxID=219649 RepID=A0ABX5KSQ9_9BURK|nr:5-carboxymethyl-2-hydroxymuconate isomerase [Paraburkholderia unamae]
MVSTVPHLIFEVTPAIHRAINFPFLARTIHERLAATGHAVLDELKSRMYATDEYLAGNDPDGEFVVVRLFLSKERPQSAQRAMGQVIHDAIREAVVSAGVAGWWQCCVFVMDFSAAPYVKTVSGTDHETSPAHA